MERKPTNTVDLYHSVYNTQIHSKENVRWVGGQSKFYVEFYGALSASVPQKGEKANVIFLCTFVVVISILSWSANFFSRIYYCICILDIFRSLEKPSINNWHLKWLCHSATLPLEEKDSCLGLFKHSILPNPYETLPSKWAFSRPWCSRLLNWERVTLFCGVSMGLKVWRGLKGLQGAKSQHLDMSANQPLHSCFLLRPSTI